MPDAKPDMDIHELPNWLRRIERDMDSLEKRLEAIEKGPPPAPQDKGDVVVKVVGKGANAALEKSVEELRTQVATLQARPAGAAPDPALGQSVRNLEERLRRVEGMEQQLNKLESKMRPGASAPSAPGAPASAGASDEALRAELEVLRREVRALASRPMAAGGGAGASGGGMSAAALAELEQRLHRVETRKAAPTMTVRGKEIPLEISGIVAGVIVISIGVIALVTGKFEPMKNPAFVIGVGLLVIGAGVVKALMLSKQNAQPAKPRPTIKK